MKSIQCIQTGSLRDTNPDTKGKIAVLDIPEPVCGDHEVKIKVAYCAICGSDPHVIEGIFGWKTPFGIGHEVSGVVVEVGKSVVSDIKVGDRVAGNFLHFCGSCYYCLNGQQQFCENIPDGNSGMSEYVCWNETQVLKLPDDISLAKGCLLEPTSIGVRISDKLNLKIGSRIAINGGGPIGNIATQILKRNGGVSVTVFEPIAERREMALENGADYVVNPFEQNIYEEKDKITNGRGYDAVVDCSGSVKAVTTLLPLVAKGGTMLFAGQYPNDFELPLNLTQYCYLNEVTVTGFFVAPYCFPRALQLLPGMKYDKFLQKSFYIDDAEEAFATHISGKYPKILINCNKDLADK